MDSRLTVACASLRLRLIELVAAYQVRVLGFESFQFRGHATDNSAATLAITGVIRSLADQLPVRDYRVEDWRTAIVGESPEDPHDHDAWKVLVQRAVRRQLGLPVEPLEADPGGHMYDAVAIALYTKYDYVAEQLAAAPGKNSGFGNSTRAAI